MICERCETIPLMPPLQLHMRSYETGNSKWSGLTKAKWLCSSGQPVVDLFLLTKNNQIGASFRSAYSLDQMSRFYVVSTANVSDLCPKPLLLPCDVSFEWPNYPNGFRSITTEEAAAGLFLLSFLGKGSRTGVIFWYYYIAKISKCLLVCFIYDWLWLSRIKHSLLLCNVSL